MSEIVVNHCTLRIVRHGGWSWGLDPKKLSDSTVQILKEIIASKLEQLWSDDVDLDITRPIQIAVPVRMSELLSVSKEMSETDDFLATGEMMSSLKQRIDQAIQTAFQFDLDVDMAAHKTEKPLVYDDYGTEAAMIEINTAKIANWRLLQPESSQGSALLKALLSWRNQGVLQQRLSLFSPSSLAAWHSQLLETNKLSLLEKPQLTPLQEAIEEFVGNLAQKVIKAKMDLAVRLRHRLDIAVETVVQLKCLPNNPALQTALERWFPLDNEPSASVDLKADSPLDLRREQTPIGVERINQRRNPAPTSQQTQLPIWKPLQQGEISISSALPFLMLGPLSRLGYLETLTATLEAAELLPALPLFAWALAFKVLDPPERGWYRGPAATTTATVFAGLEEPVAGSDVVQFARYVSDYLSPLDVTLAEALIAGHNSNQPLLLMQTEVHWENGFVLTDVEGLFPIAWVTQLEDLFPFLKQFSQIVLLIPGGSNRPEFFATFNKLGISFITDVLPTHHENWRCLRLPLKRRYWTNDHLTTESILIKQSIPFENATLEMQELWQELAVQRRSVVLTEDMALERSLTLAASVALGTLAWTLWRERESVVPQLALQRFHDLDARVFINPHSIRVRLPLGRRYQDLYQHGLLADIRDVPWLGGRILQFSGG